MGDRRRILNPEALLGITILLPSLDEQRRIVSRIKEVTAKIAEARSLRRQVELESEALCRASVFDSSNGSPTPTPMRDLVKLKEPDVVVNPAQTYQFAGVYCFGGGLFRGPVKSGAEFSYTRP